MEKEINTKIPSRSELPNKKINVSEIFKINLKLIYLYFLSFVLFFLIFTFSKNKPKASQNIIKIHVNGSIKDQNVSIQGQDSFPFLAQI